MIKIISSAPSKNDLKTIYDICNKIFKNEKYFYTLEEVKQLKKDKENTFI